MKFIGSQAVCILIALTFFGCAHMKRLLELDNHFEKANNFLKQSDFVSAIKENDLALHEPIQIRMDAVLFQRGLIYYHPKNPFRDYKIARDNFKSLLLNYPESDFAPAGVAFLIELEAIAIIENRAKENEQAAQVCEQKVKAQKKSIYGLTEKIEKLKLQIESYKTIDLNVIQRKKDHN